MNYTKLVIVFSVPFILTGPLYAQEKVWPVLMMSSGAGNMRVKAVRRTEASSGLHAPP